MKKIVTALLSLLLLSAPAINASPDIRDLLGALGSGSGSSSSESGSNALGNALGNLISGLIGDKKLSEADIAGVYKYSEPAITFKSDNFLQKAGGAAMSATIVDKLAPYYERAGMQNLVVTLEKDKTFEFALGRVKLSGTFMRDSTQEASNYFIFNFKALKNLSVGKIQADVQRTANGLIITFDASKLLTLVNTVARLTGKQTLQAAASFLNSYDGLNCGFSLTKTGEASPASTAGTSSTGSSTGNSSQSADTTTTTGSPLGSLLDMLRKR